MKVIAVVSFILITIVVGLIIFGVIYYFIYKSMINKKLESGDFEMESNKKRMPAFNSVIAFILTVIVIIGYVNINNKLNKINELDWNLTSANNKIDELNNKISSLQGEISSLKEELYKQNSDVNFLKFSFGKYHEEERTADVIFKLSPKKYSESDKYSLYLEEWDMTVELKETDEGIFEAIVRKDIFEQIPREVQYTVKREGTVENGMIKVESELDEYDTCEIWEYYLLFPKYGLNSCDYEYKDGKLSYEVWGDIVPANLVGMDVSGLVESIKIVTELDDKVIDEYETVTENHAFKLKETRDIRIDQCLEIYAEITDKYGFIYRLPLTGWTKGGEFAYDGCMDIYDKEGNLLKEGEGVEVTYYR